MNYSLTQSVPLAARPQRLSRLDGRRQLTSSPWFTAVLSIFWLLAFWGGALLVTGISLAGFAYTSRSFTIPLRAATLAFSGLVTAALISQRRWKAPGLWSIPILIFWIGYGLRILWDCYLEPVPLHDAPSVFVLQAFGMTFLPMAAFCFAPTASEARWMRAVFLSSVFLYAGLPLFWFRQFLGGGYRMLQYAADVDRGTLLGPLGFSYGGAVAVVCGLAVLMDGAKRSWFWKGALVALMVVGFSSAVFSGSKGPPLAAAIVCGLLVIVPKHSAVGSRWIRTLLVSVVVIPVAAVIVAKLGGELLGRSRITVAELEAGDESAGGRVWLWSATVQAWAASPLTGGGLEAPGSSSYPHNHILEAFYATGILGGIGFLAVSILCVRRAVRLIYAGSVHMWMAAFFLVIFTRGLWCETIINPSLWFSMMMVLSLPTVSLRRERRMMLASPRTTQGEENVRC